MNRALIWLSAAALASLSACGGGNSPAAADPEQGALMGAAIGKPFTLVNQDGKPTRWDDFAGRYRIVYFGYTYCPDVCPVDLQKIMQAYAQFGKQDAARAAKVQPIFISVDPKRDTPAVLREYVSAFSPGLIGLTGTPEQIARVAKDFAVVHAEEKQGGGSGYLVSHSRTPYLFGPDGEPIALIPVDDPATAEDDGSPAAVLAALDHWVK
jgi:protein SCO1/2